MTSRILMVREANHGFVELFRMAKSKKQLSSVYNAFLHTYDLPQMSADELRDELTYMQDYAEEPSEEDYEIMHTLGVFCNIWEHVSNMEEGVL